MTHPKFEIAAEQSVAAAAALAAAAASAADQLAAAAELVTRPLQYFLILHTKR